VWGAVGRARRRFYLRPGYLLRHAGDLVRVAITKPGVTARIAMQMLQPIRFARR
jgi:hypothetical protein